MQDCNWIRYIKRFQIICLQETWSTDCNFFLEGYKAYYVPALAQNRGRAKGGLVVFISIGLTCKIRRITSSLTGLIGLVLTGENCTAGIVNFYDANNSYTASSQIVALNVFISSSMKDCAHNLMVMGDFNVHPCGDPLFKSIMDFNCQRCEDFHFEHTIEGEHLNTMLCDLDLTATMALTDPSTCFETPTFKGNGKGTFIDFVLLTPRMQSFVDSFTIEASEYSDHNPLTGHLRGPLIIKEGVNFPIGMLSTIDGRRRLKWSMITPDALYKEIKVTCADEIMACTQEGAQPTIVLKAFQHLADKVTQLLSAPAKKLDIKGPKWFNHACSKAARNLRLALAAKPRIKANVQLCRKTYKNTIARHKEFLREEAWREILDPDTLQSSTRFWAMMKKPFLVQEPGDGLECHITKEEWEAHFKKLYCCTLDESSSPALVDGGEKICFYRGEVTEGIVRLTAGKAPWPDGIPPDLYNSDPSFWAPILESVFNAAVKEGSPQS
ncbi:uncharacterized protein LOC144771542 [Lissotriton helveticus]